MISDLQQWGPIILMLAFVVGWGLKQLVGKGGAAQQLEQRGVDIRLGPDGQRQLCDRAAEHGQLILANRDTLAEIRGAIVALKDCAQRQAAATERSNEILGQLRDLAEKSRDFDRWLKKAWEVTEPVLRRQVTIDEDSDPAVPAMPARHG